MLLKKFKNNKIYYYFLKTLIIPIYSTFWTLVLNLYAFLVGVLYQIKTINIKSINFENNSKKLVKDNGKFIEIANLINKSIDKVHNLTDNSWNSLFTNQQTFFLKHCLHNLISQSRNLVRK